ncbi:MAG: hypothetical protein ACJASQ_001611 [Crocinitomicaceae bacterium]|jgi:hypothetical protein
MDLINVRIQGETDWISFVFKVDKLNELINSSIQLPLIAYKLGSLLDGHPLDSISDDKRIEIESLLYQYVANLNIYQTMLRQELHSLFLTSFRLKGPRLGYSTRVAGAIRDKLSDTLVVSANDPNSRVPGEPGLLILLKLIGSNAAYGKDKYHSRSLAKDIIRQAKLMRGLVQVKRSAHPSNN